MKTDMVKYYYKDPATGVEMTFSKTPHWGWCIQYHVKRRDVGDVLFSTTVVPWPELSEEEQRVVDKNYEDLRERMK